MFKTTRTRPDGEWLTSFIIQVGKKAGFELPDPDHDDLYIPIKYDFINGKICVVMIKKNRSMFKIHLIPHHTFPVYLVADFSLDGITEEFLSGQKILQHYEKRFAKYHEHRSDFESKDLTPFWTISCGKDVEALMRVYDTLARIMDYKSVFNLP